MPISCCICWSSDQTDWATLQCGHVFHFTCIHKAVAVNPGCPQCRAPVNDRRAPRNAVIKLFFDADESQQDTVIDLESDEQDVAILRSRIAQLESRCSTRDQAITTLRAEDGKKGLEISRANAELTLFRAALQERELRLQAALDNANKLAARYAQYDNEIKNNKIKLKENEIYISRLTVALDPNLVGKNLFSHFSNMESAAGMPIPEYFKEMCHARNKALGDAITQKKRAEASKATAEAEWALAKEEIRQLKRERQQLEEELEEMRAHKRHAVASTAMIANATLAKVAAVPDADMPSSSWDVYMAQQQQQPQQHTRQFEQAAPPVGGGDDNDLIISENSNRNTRKDTHHRVKQRQGGVDDEFIRSLLAPHSITTGGASVTALPPSLSHQQQPAFDLDTLPVGGGDFEGFEYDDVIEIVSESEEEGDEEKKEESRLSSVAQLQHLQQRQIPSSAGTITTTTANHHNENNPFLSNSRPAARAAGVLTSAGPSKSGLQAAPGASFIRNEKLATTGLRDNAQFISCGPDGKGGQMKYYRGGSSSAAASSAAAAASSAAAASAKTQQQKKKPRSVVRGPFPPPPVAFPLLKHKNQGPSVKQVKQPTQGAPAEISRFFRTAL